VMRGTTWRFVEFKEDHLLVEAVREIGDVPSWIGEDIPVSFAVAQEVGRLRGTLDFSGYSGDAEGVHRFREYIAGLGGKPVPTDRRVTIEVARDLVVINACFGKIGRASCRGRGWSCVVGGAVKEKKRSRGMR